MNIISKLLTSLKILLIPARLIGYIIAFSLIFSTQVFAVLIEQRSKLINKFIKDMHADPIVADCAAHSAFIASTSTALNYVYFPLNSFNQGKFTVKSWNDSLDQEKQRIKVDKIVTINGLGITKDRNDKIILNFRCGYIGTQILTFNWNDPLPPFKVKSKHASKDTYLKRNLTEKKISKEKR